jgi:cytochrome c oxidase subunit III
MNKMVENALLKRREPYTFMLWLSLIGIAILFLMLTIIFIYQRVNSSLGGVRFDLPLSFWVSTIVILASSLTLFYAQKAFQQEFFKQYRYLVGLTLDLGILFIILQLLGWRELMRQDVWLQNNRTGAFLYVISGLHMAHIVGGLVFLLIIFVEAVRNHRYIDAFVYSVNPPNQLRLKLITIYWHFVDVLWVYLFLFFLLNQYL